MPRSDTISDGGSDALIGQDAQDVAYTPLDAADWPLGDPGDVNDALDVLSDAAGLAGDVNGPASSTDNAIVRWDGITGKLLQNSSVLIDDLGNTTLPGLGANGPSARLVFEYADVYIEQPNATGSHHLIMRAAGATFVRTPSTEFGSSASAKDCQIGLGLAGNNYVVISGRASPEPSRVAPAGTGGGDGGKDLEIESSGTVGRICAKENAESGVGVLGIAAFRGNYAILTRGGVHGVTTAKGDLLVRDVDRAQRLAVGSNGQLLTADSAEALGVKWAAPAGGASDVIAAGSFGPRRPAQPEGLAGGELKGVYPNPGVIAENANLILAGQFFGA